MIAYRAMRDVPGELVQYLAERRARDTRRATAATIQAIMRPDGLPVWASDAARGH